MLQVEVQEILYDARALIDEYNEDGTIISEADVATIETNGLRFINMALRQGYKDSEYYKEHNITAKRIPNLLGDGAQFDIVEFIGETQEYPNTGLGVVGAKSYFFTADSDFIVTIDEFNGTTWDNLITLNETISEKTDYKGAITPTNPDYPIRMVFGGTTYYKHMNRCLYSYPFKVSDIPDYRPWIRYDMPSDYGQVKDIIEEYPTYQFIYDVDYKWENFNTLAIRFDYEGNIKVVYYPQAQKVTSKTDLVTINNPYMQEYINFFVAAKLATTENTDLVNFFEQAANEALFKAMKKKPASERKIEDVYFDSGNNYYNKLNRRW